MGVKYRSSKLVIKIKNNFYLFINTPPWRFRERQYNEANTRHLSNVDYMNRSRISCTENNCLELVK